MSRVVLLHGIARTSASLATLARGLEGAGFTTLNVDYPSRRLPLEDLVGLVHSAAGPFLTHGDGNAHFVAHSMGGLLARAYVVRHRPPRLGRMVLLGPPNQGSEIADLLAPRWLYKKVFGPAGQQLGTGSQGQLSRSLGALDYSVGVIAGDRTIDPVGWLLLPRPNDGRVSVARTKVAGMAAHLTLPVSHALMMRSPEVIRQAIIFLRTGRFAGD